MNHLGGAILERITRIFNLRYLNVSDNNLEGEITAMLGSRFSNPGLFASNPNLCGKPLAANCAEVGSKRRKQRREKLILLICIVAGSAILLALLCGCCFLSLVRWAKRYLDHRAGVKKRSPERRSGSADSRSGAENGGAKVLMSDQNIIH